jgi:radical SAM enzyme (TIGR01210 family)
VLTFPESPAERDQWILARRAPRPSLNLHEPYACFAEEECGPSGHPEPVSTVFLTNRECPFHCTMCDLWRNTLVDSVPAGAIPQQIGFALNRLPEARTIKLYNSGSFFDPRAIPPADYPAIAQKLQRFDRIIVECHPAFVGSHTLGFRDLLPGKLEVAMGLEIANSEILAKLNKRMTLDQFAQAADFLRHRAIDLRVFVLVQPPFLAASLSFFWAQRSLEFAFACGATAVTLIPTRGGNGAMEALEATREFTPPALCTVEMAMAYGLSLRQGRVFTDLWELQRGRECPHCFLARIERLRRMNLCQRLLDPVCCAACNSHRMEAR